jgi:hypothetical protein
MLVCADSSDNDATSVAATTAQEAASVRTFRDMADEQGNGTIRRRITAAGVTAGQRP